MGGLIADLERVFSEIGRCSCIAAINAVVDVVVDAYALNIDVRNAVIDHAAAIGHAVISKAGSVGAELIEPSGAEGVDVDESCGGVEGFEGDIFVRPGTGIAAVGVVVQLGDEEAAGELVFRCHVIVNATIELTPARVIEELEGEFEVWDAIKAISRSCVGNILADLGSASGCGGADVQPPADGGTGALVVIGTGTGNREHGENAWGVSGRADDMGRDAALAG